jgi:starch phosphorylase
VIIAGKAAPGYTIARLIIKLIHSVAEVINHDPGVRELLRVAFLPNYNVSLAESIFPATDLSEQISTAGTEASGTANMKAMLNGALTLGTLDGANIEILDAVGEENIFVFGKTADEVDEAIRGGSDPMESYRQDPALRQALDLIQQGFFSSGDRTAFQPLLDSIFHGGDRYMVMADFAAYAACQQRVSEAFLNKREWTRKSIMNVAHAGQFSSDRTVLSYAELIWSQKPRHESH